jgi:hypothetical protein
MSPRPVNKTRVTQTTLLTLRQREPRGVFSFPRRVGRDLFLHIEGELAFDRSPPRPKGTSGSQRMSVIRREVGSEG